MRFAAAILGVVIALADAGIALADDWTGVYVGGSIGRRNVDAQWETTCLAEGFPPPFNVCPDASGTYTDRIQTNNPAELGATDTVVRGYGGAQIQLKYLVLGFEGDWGHASTDLFLKGIPGTEAISAVGQFAADEITISAEWDASIRGRVGFLISPTTMLFATGGVAWMKLEASTYCEGDNPINNTWCSPENNGYRDSYSEVVRGQTWGGGIESMLSSHLLLRLEYRHADFERLQHIFFDERVANADAVSARISTETDTFSLGLAYKY